MQIGLCPQGEVEPPILLDGRLSPLVFNDSFLGRAVDILSTSRGTDLIKGQFLQGKGRSQSLTVEGKVLEPGGLQKVSSTDSKIELDPSGLTYRRVESYSDKERLHAISSQTSWEEQSGFRVSEDTKQTGLNFEKEAGVSKKGG